jgi:hypothetical protein
VGQIPATHLYDMPPSMFGSLLLQKDGDATCNGLLGPDTNRQHDQLQAWTATVPTDVPLATHATRKQRAQAAAVELFRLGFSFVTLQHCCVKDMGLRHC